MKVETLSRASSIFVGVFAVCCGMVDGNMKQEVLMPPVYGVDVVR
jgi:hypothetical protein